MKRPRKFAVIGTAAAALVAGAAIFGAVAANADPAAVTAAARPAVASSTVTPSSQPGQQNGSQNGTRNGDQNGSKNAQGGTPTPKATQSSQDKTIAKVKAAVLKKYPTVKITKVTAVSKGGWTVAVTTRKGVQGTVSVDRTLHVGSIVPVKHHG